MTVKDIIGQIETSFGRLPEKFLFQLINDALDDIASKKKNYQVSQITDLEGYKRWYELDDQVISIKRVEVLDTNDRYVMIPKLADAHRLLRADTDSADDSLK
tara:strand:- start:416 stop:721 length:306 start_codon:yes stop_codon:yes gene_type:complete